MIRTGGMLGFHIRGVSEKSRQVVEAIRRKLRSQIAVLALKFLFAPRRTSR